MSASNISLYSLQAAKIIRGRRQTKMSSLLHLDVLAFIYISEIHREDTDVFLNGSQLRAARMAQLQGTGLLNLRLASPVHNFHRLPSFKPRSSVTKKKQDFVKDLSACTQSCLSD